VAALTTGPASVLGIDVPQSDLVVIDPALRWTPTHLVSRGQNSPLIGRELVGKVIGTLVDGAMPKQEFAPVGAS
jgi:dihydroorotase-like cyclic amidohydrolase